MGNFGHNYLTNCWGVRSQLLISGKFMFSCLGVTKVIYCSTPRPSSPLCTNSKYEQSTPTCERIPIIFGQGSFQFASFLCGYVQGEVKIIVSGRFTIFPERCLPFFNLSRANNSKGLFFKKKSFLNSIATFWCQLTPMFSPGEYQGDWTGGGQTPSPHFWINENNCVAILVLTFLSRFVKIVLDGVPGIMCLTQHS